MPKADHYAVVVGISSYPGLDGPALDGPAEDVRRFAAWLAAPVSGV